MIHNQETTLTLGPSERGFKIGLYQEHLEEISFLFTQCKSYFFDPEMKWTDIAEFEERLAAHVDAIELGGELALQCAWQLLKSGDEEEIKGAVYTLAAVNKGRATGDLIFEMEKADKKLIPSFVKGFKHTNFSVGLSDKLSPIMSHERQEIRDAVIEILSYRREGKWGEGRIGKIVSESSPIYLAISGKANDLPVLLSAMKNQDTRLSALKGIGILGNMAGVDALLSELKSGDEAIMVAAGEGLEFLTGAGLKEKITVIEEVDPDELIEGEKPPEPKSKEIERVCTSYDTWADWRRKKFSIFKPDIRLRYGKPFDLGMCIDEMRSENAGFYDRQRAYLELFFRSGHDIPFEPDWWVDKQKESISRWQGWWEENKKKFSPGKWYFQGKVI